MTTATPLPLVSATIASNLLEDPTDPTWRLSALCAQTDPELFFPEKGGSTAQAKSICRHCEVRTACLDHALTTGQRDGIWGGLSPRQRQLLNRQRAANREPAAA